MNDEWGMTLRSRIPEAKHAKIFWGACALAKPEHRDFEIDIDRQGFYIIDDSGEVPEDRKMNIVRALSIAFESGGIMKSIKNKVHIFRHGRLIPKRNRPIKTFDHAMKMISSGKIDRATAVRLWVDEEKPTMIKGGRKIHQVYEDESCLGYADTLGSEEELQILFFIKHEEVERAKLKIGEVIVRGGQRMIVLGATQSDGELFYNVFLVDSKVTKGKRIVRLKDSEVDPSFIEEGDEQGV
jgi:hypothetical protein